MRQRDAASMVLGEVRGEVADVRVEPPGIDRVHDRLFVDDAFAREVQDHGALFHERQALGVHELLRRFVQGHVDADEIRGAKHLVERRAFLTVRESCHAPFDRESRIEPTTFIPSETAGLATSRPMAPSPVTPSVRPGNSTPRMSSSGLDRLAELVVRPFEPSGEVPSLAD